MKKIRRKRYWNKSHNYGLLLMTILWLCSGIVVSAQNVEITGKVTDAENDEPLMGVAVVVAGTTRGVITDVSGNYSISASSSESLQFRMIGFETVEVAIGSKKQIDVSMNPRLTELDEVVVIGYGTVKKRDLTGSVGSISSKQLEQVHVTNPQLALQGRIPGVQVTQTDFSPSGGLNIRIRGTRSFQASNDPLYVVDGMMLTTGLSFLDPNDIESIDVLKDASATAIYGSRGANGVVIITTKRGKDGKAQVEYNGYVGVQQIARKLDMMNAPEWIEYMREAHRQANGNLKYDSPVASMTEDQKVTRFTDDPYVLQTVMSGWNQDGSYWDPNKVHGFDWIDAVTQTGFTQNHNLSVRGGNGKTQYSVGGSYTNTDGVVKNRAFERITARSAVDTELSKRFKAGMTFQYSHTQKNK